MTSGSPLTLPTSERRDSASAASSVWATEAVKLTPSVAVYQLGNTQALPDLTQLVGQGASGIDVRDVVLLDYFTCGVGTTPTTVFSEWPVSGVQFYDWAAPRLSGLLPSAFSAVDESLSRDAKAEADRALEQLSHEHRTVLILHEFEQMEYKQIARQMQCSIGTVMSRLFYARRRMASLLAGLKREISE